jgi:hypothetical protein
VKIVK